MKQAITLILAMLIGALFPSLEIIKDFLPLLLGIVMFFPFLSSEIHTEDFVIPQVWLVFLMMLGISLGSYVLLFSFSPVLALVAFIVAFTPTAAAAPTMVMVFKGNVRFAIASVVLTHAGIALFLPVLAPLVAPSITVTSLEMFIRIFWMIFPPFFIAKTIRYFLPSLAVFLLKGKEIGFYAWALLIVSGVAQASAYLQKNTDDIALVYPIIAIAFALCFFHFLIGEKIGGKFSEEFSQCYGQRNVGFMIWIATTFLGPLYVLGPSFYILAQHMVNIFKLILSHRSNK